MRTNVVVAMGSSGLLYAPEAVKPNTGARTSYAKATEKSQRREHVRVAKPRSQPARVFRIGCSGDEWSSAPCTVPTQPGHASRSMFSLVHAFPGQLGLKQLRVPTFWRRQCRRQDVESEMYSTLFRISPSCIRVSTTIVGNFVLSKSKSKPPRECQMNSM